MSRLGEQLPRADQSLPGVVRVEGGQRLRSSRASTGPGGMVPVPRGPQQAAYEQLSAKQLPSGYWFFRLALGSGPAPTMLMNAR